MKWHEAHRFRISLFLYMECPDFELIAGRSYTPRWGDLSLSHILTASLEISRLFIIFLTALQTDRRSLDEWRVKTTLKQRRGGKTSTELCDFQIVLLFVPRILLDSTLRWVSDNAYFRWWMLDANKCKPCRRYSGVQSKMWNDFIATITAFIEDE